MVMDRAEKLGLGAALGGHAVLLGAMVLGLFLSAEPLTRTEAISVSLVGEIADVSTAPDAIQEESAPPAQGETETPEPQAIPDKMTIEKPVAKPVEKPQKRDVALVPKKAAPKKVAVKQPPPKQAIKSGGLTGVEAFLKNQGKTDGEGKAVGTPASKTAAEVRRAISVSINTEVRGPWNRCKFSGVDVEQLKTVVRFGLNRDGSLGSFRSVVTSGQNDSNKFQVNRHQECAKLAVSQASPFNLPTENYDFWKDYELELFKK